MSKEDGDITGTNAGLCNSKKLRIDFTSDSYVVSARE